MKIDIKFKWGSADLQMFNQIKEEIETYKIDFDYVEDEKDLIYAIVDAIYHKHGIVCHNDEYVKNHTIDFDVFLQNISWHF